MRRRPGTARTRRSGPRNRWGRAAAAIVGTTLSVVALAAAAAPRGGAVATGLVAGAVAQANPSRAAELERRWGTRLEALDPSRPLDYFELAEEVDDARAVGLAAAGDAVAEAERRLALDLFRIAGRLDPDLAPGAARALADLVRDGRDRRRLLSIAELLEGDRLLRARPPRSQRYGADGGGASLAVRVTISRAIAAMRTGRGADAIERIDRLPPDEVEAALRPWPGGPGGFRTDAGRLTGALGTDAALTQFAAESVMLAGDRAGWAAIARAGGGDPLVELDLEDIAAIFERGATGLWWRRGGWVDAPVG